MKRDVEEQNRLARERSAELRSMPTPTIEGWAYGVRLDGVYRVIAVPGGVRAYHAWQGVGEYTDIPDRPIAPGESHEDYHERTLSRRRRVMVEMMGGEL